MSTNFNFNFNEAPEQRTFDVIPAGSICTLQLKIHPGGAGDDGWLTNASDSASKNLNCEFTVVDTEHAKRKIFQRLTLEGTAPGHAEASEISKATLRAMLESGRGIRPGDNSDSAQAARKVSGFGDFDGLRFVARIGVKPAQNGYPAKNTFIVLTPEHHNWKQPEQIQTKTATNTAGVTSAPSTQAANAIARPQWAG